MEPGREVQQILCQVEAELLALMCAELTGTITLHCGVDKTVIEVNRKLEPIKRQPKPVTQVRRGWE